MPELFAAINGVEVFRPGEWHGRIYTNDDMLKIAANSQRINRHNRAKLRLGDPAIKVGSHDPASDFLRKAAFGAVASFYTKPIEVDAGVLENRVFVDFSNVPDVVAKALQFFPERSVEKYKMFPDPDTNELIEDVITSVAFLGTIPPEVKKLSDEYAILFNADNGNESDQIDKEEFSFTGVPIAVLVALPQSAGRSKPMFDRNKAKERLLAGATDEEMLKEFEGMTPEDLLALKEEIDKAKTPAPAPKKADDNASAPAPKKSDDDVPAGFSESQVAKMIQDAMQKQQEQFQVQLNQQKEEFAARAAELEGRATKAEQDALDKWYDSLKSNGLPASLDSFAPVQFAQKLDQLAPEKFGESEVTMRDQFKAMLEHFASLSGLTSKSMVDPTMKQGTTEAKGYAAAVEAFAAAHPEMNRQQVMMALAAEQPQVFNVTE